MKILVALVVVAIFVSMVAAMWIDITGACREALLDELWDDGDPCRNTDAVQATASAE